MSFSRYLVAFNIFILVLTQTVLNLMQNKLKDAKILNCSQPAITCSKVTIETLEQGVKYVQS